MKTIHEEEGYEPTALKNQNLQPQQQPQSPPQQPQQPQPQTTKALNGDVVDRSGVPQNAVTTANNANQLPQSAVDKATTQSASALNESNAANHNQTFPSSASESGLGKNQFQKILPGVPTTKKVLSKKKTRPLSAEVIHR